jgi:hypothetical protein
MGKQSTKEDAIMEQCIGAIYRLKNGAFEAAPWVSASPCCEFENPHLAEKYLRDITGIHPVVETSCLPLHQTNGEGWPLGAVGVWIKTQ